MEKSYTYMHSTSSDVAILHKFCSHLVHQPTGVFYRLHTDRKLLLIGNSYLLCLKGEGRLRICGYVQLFKHKKFFSLIHVSYVDYILDNPFQNVFEKSPYRSSRSKFAETFHRSYRRVFQS